MDFMTVLGLVAGIGTVYYVLSAGDILHLLLNPVAAVLVFGGTFSATLISYPWEIIRQALPSFRLVLFPGKTTDEDRRELIEQITAMAEKARRTNIESLQDDIPNINNRFLLYGLHMLIDGMKAEVIKEHMEKEIMYTRQRHHNVTSVFRTMATLSPIFGLLGTLIGVVQVLRNLSDPTSMGNAMAIAITTTFYGIFAANFIFLPIAIKLNELSQRNVMSRELITEGVLSIQQGELPLIVRKKLNAFLSYHARAKGAKKK